MKKYFVICAALLLLASLAQGLGWQFGSSAGGIVLINGHSYIIDSQNSSPDGTLTFSFIPFPEADPSYEEPIDPADYNKKEPKIEVGFSGGYVDPDGTEHEEWNTGPI